MGAPTDTPAASQMLDGELHPHTGPELQKYNIFSRLTFGPAGSIVGRGCCAGKKRKPVEHAILWNFPAVGAYHVWKRFKPYWEEERAQAEYAFLRHLTGPLAAQTPKRRAAWS